MSCISEVIVTKDQADAVVRYIQARSLDAHTMQKALRELLARRVPDAMPAQGLTLGDWDHEAHGFNVCRGKVLKGE